MRAMKKLMLVLMTLLLTMSGCGTEETCTVKVFAAASLADVMSELESSYEKLNPGVDIIINTDSSGVLVNQIREGAPCDLFFSAGESQMDELESDNLLIEGSRVDVVNNQLAVITRADADTAVTGLADIDRASSLALADGSVPAGSYARAAMLAIGIISSEADPASISTAEVAEQLGGIEISEQGNVSKVLAAVEEGASEVGIVYLSDTVGHESEIRVLELVPSSVTGNICYPAALVSNDDASEDSMRYARDFLEYITGDDACRLYRSYGFDITRG